MLVYGDRTGWRRPEQAIAAAKAALYRASNFIGLERHAALVEAFLEAGELAQSLADHEFEGRGFDTSSPSQLALSSWLTELADLVDRSWSSDFRAPLPPVADSGVLSEHLRGLPPLRRRRPEGYEFYALYPELYMEAARCSRLPRATCIVGIRSIGLGLAALVAAALGAPPPVSVCPVGHPFRRDIKADPSLVSIALADSDVAVAVVDEGPGLSGSSFAAVVDWLASLGIARQRVHLFPSHDNSPGSATSPVILATWNSCSRHPASFEREMIDPPAERLRTWVKDALGHAILSFTDISHGKWRAVSCDTRTGRLPCDGSRERRKYLARTPRGSFLVKFAGLGATGREKLELAKSLNAQGFAPEPIALVHGFLVERWIQGTSLARARVRKDDLIPWLGRYLGFRAGLCEKEWEQASLKQLAEMAEYNSGQVLGTAFSRRLRCWMDTMEVDESAVTPVRVDGRLHAWEFLVTPQGELVKTDALDHHAAHDPVGCQDIAWDIAAAGIEHGLSAGELDVLRETVEAQARRPVCRKLVAFYAPCYLAFQLGLWSFAGAGGPASETVLRDRYRGLLNDFPERRIWVTSDTHS